MRIWTSEHTFNHPWETVAQAAWRKYPNPMNPAVVGIDVLDRKVEDGVLQSHRIISSQWGLPGWVRSLIGTTNICYASEFSEVNPKTRKMTMKTRNLTFCNFIAVDETLSYVPDPEDSSKTLLKQEAVVTVRGVPLNSYMENLLTSTISTNASKGRLGMEWVIGMINEEVAEITKTTDEFITTTRRSLDDLSVAAKKSLDDLQTLAKSPSCERLPKF